MFQEILFDEADGYPVGKGLFYRCNLCHEILPSDPEALYKLDRWSCACGNLTLDPDAGRLSVKKPGSLSLLEETT